MRRGCAGLQNPFTPFGASDVEDAIAARFELQVAKAPHALAVTDDTHRWSYEDLNGFANRIGAELLGFTQPNDAPVALLFEHGAPAIAAMLGVLKAGRCYVPLNVLQPAARLRRILDDCGAKIIVSNDRNAALADETSSRGERVISIDGFRDERLTANLGPILRPRSTGPIVRAIRSRPVSWRFGKNCSRSSRLESATTSLRSVVTRCSRSNWSPASRS